MSSFGRELRGRWRRNSSRILVPCRHHLAIYVLSGTLFTTGVVAVFYGFVYGDEKVIFTIQ